MAKNTMSRMRTHTSLCSGRRTHVHCCPICIFNKIHATRKPLEKALNDWLKVRNAFPKEKSNIQRAAKNKFKENTVVMIDSLAKCVMECQQDG